MPPSGRSRYPHAFSRSPIRHTSEGSRRGSRAAAEAYAVAVAETVQAWLQRNAAAYAHCRRCKHHRRIDLAALAQAGLGPRRVCDLRPVCGRCGSRACYINRG